jgi:tryptophan synthase alpha chain
MSRYEKMFKRLDEANEGAFIPFVTIGDPSINESLEIIRTLVKSGADALELGLPFSDPIADGPTIQKANIRALNSKTTIDECFGLIKTIRNEYPDTPIGLLLYSNLIMAKGINEFYQTAKAAGVDSILVADVPIRESQPFRKAATTAGIDPVFIVPPSVTDDTMRQVASYSRGYTYLLSRAGVTGAETKATMPSNVMIKKLTEYQAARPILGFGIGKPDQVKAAIDAGAAGAISGSAVVNIIERHSLLEPMLKELSEFVTNMKAATKK